MRWLVVVALVAIAVVVVGSVVVSLDCSSGGKLHAPPFPQQTRCRRRHTGGCYKVGVVKLFKGRALQVASFEHTVTLWIGRKREIKKERLKQMKIEGTETATITVGHQ